MQLKFMEQRPLDPAHMTCPYCQEVRRIGVHSHKERRFICYSCRHTFIETKGTIFYGLHYPIWVVVLVMTLLAYGCPVPAIVAAFFIDERTVRHWLEKAGGQAKQVQQSFICNGQVELGQVQGDELCVNIQGNKVWVATAMVVFSRLFLWGEVSYSRDSSLIEAVMIKVKEATSNTAQRVLIAVDGFAAYPKVILKVFHTKLRKGLRERPKYVPWPNLHIVQVIKSYCGRKLKKVTRSVFHGSSSVVNEIINQTQNGSGTINTAFIERLNATFRARTPILARHTRNWPHKISRVEQEVFWFGAVYNFCTIHESLGKTPAMAAQITDHAWSIEYLLCVKCRPN